MTSSGYSDLSFEEKANLLETEEVLVTRRSSRRWRITFVAALVLLVVVGMLSIARTGSSFGNAIAVNEDESAERLNIPRVPAAGTQYLLGVGKADITGPVVELNFMGYASLAQVGTGLRQRIYSRAFIIGSPTNPEDRFIYLVLDTSTGDTAVRYGVLEALANLGPEYAIYGQQNVAVTGTHSHSGPGAWVNYLLPQITSLGFDKQSYQAIVDGTILSIKRAHESLALGSLSYGSIDIQGANINRSPYAYLANPAAERAQYTADVDKTLTMLRFQRASDSKNIGVLTWFPVHGTSMLENNTHVTGDNKGVAAYLFEQSASGDSTAAEGFVAGFSQANVGDTSPNVLGAWCDDGSGQMCTFENSTCGGTSQACHGRGPLFQKLDLGVSSCYEIGRRQYAGAKSLYDSFDTISTPVTDASVKSFHFYQDMSYFTFPLPDGTTAQTCPAALGYSFAGGTTDGPGAFDFTQNENSTSKVNPLWEAVRDLLKTPGSQQVACQSPKPILLDVGEQTVPYQWTPDIVDVQMLRVGQFFVIVSPSEATTMSGRRWKAAVKNTATQMSLTSTEPMVVLGAPANSYAHYLTTEEEYGIQRYEGASTLYGKHTLDAYIHLSTSNMDYLAASSTTQPPNGPLPPNNVNNSLSFITGVVYDNPPLFKSFGDVTTQPKSSYTRGDVVTTVFIGANPRNNLRLGQTFTAVEKLNGATWTQVRSDADWSLVYTWKRDDGLLGTSHVTIDWETEASAEPGTYRIHYYGDHKNPIGGSISPFEGVSQSFILT